jgi:hypothetical protein
MKNTPTKTETIRRLEIMIGELNCMTDYVVFGKTELIEAMWKLQDADIKLRASMGPFAPKPLDKAVA